LILAGLGLGLHWLRRSTLGLGILGDYTTLLEDEQAGRSRGVGWTHLTCRRCNASLSARRALH